MRHEIIRGLKTEWYDNGNIGKPVIFFQHGFPDHPYIWSKQFEEFNLDFHLIAPSLRGVGNSAEGEGLSRCSFLAYELDMTEVLERSGVNQSEKIIFIAHDISGPYIEQFSNSFPDRVLGVVYLNSMPMRLARKRLLKPFQMLKSWYIAPFVTPIANRFFVSMLLEQYLKRFCPEFFDSHNRLELREAQNLLKYYQYLGTELVNFSPEPISADCESLLIFGNKDPFVDVPKGSDLDTLGSVCTLRVIEGNHWIQDTQFQQVNRILRGFIDERIRSVGKSNPEKQKRA